MKEEFLKRFNREKICVGIVAVLLALFITALIMAGLHALMKVVVPHTTVSKIIKVRIIEKH